MSLRRPLPLLALPMLLFACQADPPIVPDGCEEERAVSDDQDGEKVPDINPELEAWVLDTTKSRITGYGYSFGRPEYDTVLTSSFIRFKKHTYLGFEDSLHDYSLYRTNSQYYPRKLVLDNHCYFFIERNEGVAVCNGVSLISVFKFDAVGFVDSSSICPDDYSINMSEVQTDKDLEKIVQYCFGE